MEQIKRFVSLYVPVTSCTLRCHYCYITQHRLFDNKIPNPTYTAEQVRSALSKHRMGGVCLINFCGGGETLLPSYTIDYIRALLEEGHYVNVVTNGTVSQRFKQISEFPSELLKRLFFKFSYHYLQFKERNLLGTFFNNVRLVRDAGASFTIEATPSDELIPFVDEMVDACIEGLGAAPHITVARDETKKGFLPILTNMTRDEYHKVWDKLNSSFFEYKMSIFGHKRKEFCYAGAWSCIVNLGTGEMKQCYYSNLSQNIFDDPEKPIEFLPIGRNCRQHHCYNGHAFLVLGDIPELGAPTYAEIRDRVCKDGSHWLKPDMLAFMSTKLYNSNALFSEDEKNVVDKRNRQLARKRIFNSVLRKLKLKK